MAYEIYYTSAPEGLRPGQHGFCTVAATEKIPRPLLERLEPLSGYRHAFEAGSISPSNPVAWAHWNIRAAGRSHHVLSRVCDAGFDYSKRNNVFAHHVVVDANEMAAGGPAWMLGQSGLMVRQWDGRVGDIARSSPLPQGDEAPARCVAWDRAVGDAGWAGVLAESAARTPAKPACILYSADTDVLALVAEAIRLLPRNLRWQVTFNTYFTSIPSSASCLWRCCLAGSPAADAASRYAASGVVIDLTSSSLGAPPASPYVELARTGQASSPGAAAPPKVKTWSPAAPREPAAYALAGEESPIAQGSPPRRADASSARPRRPLRLPKLGGARPDDVDEETRRPWRKVAALYLLACAAIGAGTWFVIHAARSVSPPDQPTYRPGPGPMPPGPDTVNVTSTTASGPPARAAPATAQTPTTLVVAPPVTRTVDPTTSATQDVRVVDPAPPRKIVLGVDLARPGAGTGLRDPTQMIRIPPAEIDNLRGISWLRCALPGDRAEVAYEHGDLAGTVSVVADSAGGKPGVMIRWKDKLGSPAPSEVLGIHLDKARPQLQLTWRTSTLVRRPEVAALVYWLARNASLSVGDPQKTRPQAIDFPRLSVKPVSVVDFRSEIDWPLDLPSGAMPEVESPPPGWRATSRLHPKEADRHTPQTAWRLVEMRKAGVLAASDMLFVLSFRPGLKVVESDLATRIQTEMLNLQTAQDELTAIKEQIDKVQLAARRDMEDNERIYADSPQELKFFNDARKTRLAEDLKPLEARRGEQDRLIASRQQALAEWRDVPGFDVAIKLPDGTRLATVPVRGSSR